MFASKFGITTDCHVSDFEEPTGLSHTIAFDNVFEDRNDFVGGQAGVKESRAAAFGKFCLAYAATEQADVFVFAIPSTHVDIFAAANAEQRTLFILTAKLLKVVHDYAPQYNVLENKQEKQHERRIEKYANPVNAK